MGRKEEALLKMMAFTIAASMLIIWLQSRPSCDRGCKTQLQHLNDHLVKEFVFAIVPGLRAFLG
jgi:hypothetical protein